MRRRRLWIHLGLGRRVAADEILGHEYGGGVHDCLGGQQLVGVGDGLHLRLAALEAGVHLVHPRNEVVHVLHLVVVAHGGQGPDPGQLLRLLLAGLAAAPANSAAWSAHLPSLYPAPCLVPLSCRSSARKDRKLATMSSVAAPLTLMESAVEGPGLREEGVVAVARDHSGITPGLQRPRRNSSAAGKPEGS